MASSKGESTIERQGPNSLPKVAPSDFLSLNAYSEQLFVIPRALPKSDGVDKGAVIEENEACLSHLLLAQRGDLQSQEWIVQRYQQRIAGFVFTFLSEEAAVEDLSQQIFIKMLRSLPQLKDPSLFESWLFRLARNTCLNHIRAEKWRRLLIPFAAHHEPPAEAETGEDPRLSWLEKAIRSLPEPQRELLTLMQDDRFSYEELARITGTTVSAVKSRLFRAREQLKKIRDHEL